MLCLEWVAPEDPAVLLLGHTSMNAGLHREAYSTENFEAAILEVCPARVPVCFFHALLKLAAWARVGISENARVFSVGPISVCLLPRYGCGSTPPPSLPPIPLLLSITSLAGPARARTSLQ